MGWFVQSVPADSGFAGDPTSLTRDKMYVTPKILNADLSKFSLRGAVL